MIETDISNNILNETQQIEQKSILELNKLKMTYLNS
jgi:hypothetical protein